MAIDIGSAAINRGSTVSEAYTSIDSANAANGNGTLVTFELWFATDGAGVKVGTFSFAAGQFTSRDFETIGNVTSGSKQTFSGLSCTVAISDCIGVYSLTGAVEVDTSGGTSINIKVGDQFGAGAQTYTSYVTYALSAYGTDVAAGWANIKKINGIASAGFSKRNGIAVALIKKVNGIAV